LQLSVHCLWLLLSGCYKDGDGKLELKEPKKELSEMPERKNWLEMDVSDPDKFKKQTVWHLLSEHFIKLWGLAKMLKSPIIFLLVFILLLSFSSAAFAELAYIDPATNQSVLDQVIQKFLGKVKILAKQSYKVQLSACFGRWC
jgi:hypothetical protein